MVIRPRKNEPARLIFSLFRQGGELSGPWLYEMADDLTDLKKLNLAIALEDFAKTLHEMVDAASAERQINSEVERRIRALYKTAMAAGKTSDLWNNENSKYYRQRMKLVGQLR